MPITATATVAPPPSHPHEVLKTQKEIRGDMHRRRIEAIAATCGLIVEIRHGKSD